MPFLIALSFLNRLVAGFAADERANRTEGVHFAAQRVGEVYVLLDVLATAVLVKVGLHGCDRLTFNHAMGKPVHH
jgi:hypothetical protein